MNGKKLYYVGKNEFCLKYSEIEENLRSFFLLEYFEVPRRELLVVNFGELEVPNLNLSFSRTTRTTQQYFEMILYKAYLSSTQDSDCGSRASFVSVFHARSKRY